MSMSFTDSSGSPCRPQRQILSVRDLTVDFANGARPAVSGVSFDLWQGEIVALVGESGSGKSMTAMSIMQLLPAGARISSGTIEFDGVDLRTLSATLLDSLRGGRLSMLFQQPRMMLDPTARVGVQVGEPLRVHDRVYGRANQARVLELLAEVGIPAPKERIKSYAHELSGGMAQRVMMAAALSGSPDLLIADEPTTALDVTVQAQILRLLDAERRRRGLAMLLITHDLPMAAAIADRVIVMHDGKIVESGPSNQVLSAPTHPYTQSLLRCSLLQEWEDEPPKADYSADGVAQAAEFIWPLVATDARGIGEQRR